MGMQTIYPNRLAQETAENKEIKTVSAATTLGVYDQVVIATLPASVDYDITLPPVAEARGLKFYIEATGTGSGEVAVVDQGDGLNALTVGDKLSAAGDYIYVENVAGRFYIVVKDVTTS